MGWVIAAAVVLFFVVLIAWGIASVDEEEKQLTVTIPTSGGVARTITVGGVGGGGAVSTWMATGGGGAGIDLQNALVPFGSSLMDSDIRWQRERQTALMIQAQNLQGFGIMSSSWQPTRFGTAEWVKENEPNVESAHVDHLSQRLHRHDGPALVMKNGTKYYFINGIQVVEYIVMEPDTISVWAIDRESNSEVRRVMIERYLGGDPDDGLDGYGRYVRDSGAEKIHEDKCGILWRKEMRNDEAIHVVEVVNSTPEPDGHSKRYMLRVPPDTRTARQGVAWTFGLKSSEYEPAVQT